MSAGPAGGDRPGRGSPGSRPVTGGTRKRAPAVRSAARPRGIPTTPARDVGEAGVGEAGVGKVGVGEAGVGEAAIDVGTGPASRRALRSQGRRTMRKLLDAAMEVFDERGYHATRVNDVVEAADTSHGTFYLYFSNKEDLLRALVVEATTEGQALRGSLLGRPEGGASREELRMWIGRHSSFWTRYGPLLRAWTDLAVLDAELGHQVRDMLTATIDSLAVHIANADTGGDMNPRTAAMAVLGMVGRFHQLREFLGEPIDEEALETLTTITFRALFDPQLAST